MVPLSPLSRPPPPAPLLQQQEAEGFAERGFRCPPPPVVLCFSLLLFLFFNPEGKKYIYVYVRVYIYGILMAAQNLFTVTVRAVEINNFLSD